MSLCLLHHGETACMSYIHPYPYSPHFLLNKTSLTIYTYMYIVKSVFLLQPACYCNFTHAVHEYIFISLNWFVCLALVLVQALVEICIYWTLHHLIQDLFISLLVYIWVSYAPQPMTLLSDPMFLWRGFDLSHVILFAGGLLKSAH